MEIVYFQSVKSIIKGKLEEKQSVLAQNKFKNPNPRHDDVQKNTVYINEAQDSNSKK